MRDPSLLRRALPIHGERSCERSIAVALLGKRLQPGWCHAPQRLWRERYLSSRQPAHLGSSVQEGSERDPPRLAAIYRSCPIDPHRSVALPASSHLATDRQKASTSALGQQPAAAAQASLPLLDSPTAASSPGVPWT